MTWNRRLGAWIDGHRTQLGLTLRVSVAAVVSLGAAQLLHLHLPLWAVLTGIFVTQMSVGRSLKATLDYLSGTLGGAAFGTAIALLIPHDSEWSLLLVLAIAVAPMALLAALKPNFGVAPATAIIVILMPAMTHATPSASALDRILEVLAGGLSGLLVSFLVFPSNAHRIAIDAAARTLDRMADALSELFEGMEKGLDIAELHKLQDHIGQALAELNTIGSEAERERRVRLAREPRMRPLLGTLLRLRHDVVMIGRVAIQPLPDAFRSRLAGPMRDVEAAITGYLRASGVALVARQTPPPAQDVEAALAAYGAEVTAIRRAGLTQSLPDESAERFFALGFVLEQMHQNLLELAAGVTEWAADPRE